MLIHAYDYNYVHVHNWSQITHTLMIVSPQQCVVLKPYHKYQGRCHRGARSGHGRPTLWPPSKEIAHSGARIVGTTDRSTIAAVSAVRHTMRFSMLQKKVNMSVTFHTRTLTFQESKFLLFSYLPICQRLTTVARQLQYVTEPFSLIFTNSLQHEWICVYFILPLCFSILLYCKYVCNHDSKNIPVSYFIALVFIVAH